MPAVDFERTQACAASEVCWRCSHIWKLLSVHLCPLNLNLSLSGTSPCCQRLQTLAIIPAQCALRLQRISQLSPVVQIDAASNGGTYPLMLL